MVLYLVHLSVDQSASQSWLFGGRDRSIDGSLLLQCTLVSFGLPSDTASEISGRLK